MISSSTQICERLTAAVRYGSVIGLAIVEPNAVRPIGRAVTAAALELKWRRKQQDKTITKVQKQKLYKIIIVFIIIVVTSCCNLSTASVMWFCSGCLYLFTIVFFRFIFSSSLSWTDQRRRNYELLNYFIII